MVLVDLVAIQALMEQMVQVVLAVTVVTVVVVFQAGLVFQVIAEALQLVELQSLMILQQLHLYIQHLQVQQLALQLD